MTVPLTPLNAPRRRRKNPLPYILAGGALAGLAGYILYGQLSQNIEYFVTPTEYSQQQSTYQGRTVSMGGLVKKVHFDRQTLNLTFDLTDGGATYPVTYQGAVSDLFKENQGAIVRGQFNAQNVFVANSLIVKHSEEYRVPKTQGELKDMLRNAESEQGK